LKKKRILDEGSKEEVQEGDTKRSVRKESNRMVVRR